RLSFPQAASASATTNAANASFHNGLKFDSPVRLKIPPVQVTIIPFPRPYPQSRRAGDGIVCIIDEKTAPKFCAAEKFPANADRADRRRPGTAAPGLPWVRLGTVLLRTVPASPELPLSSGIGFGTAWVPAGDDLPGRRLFRRGPDPFCDGSGGAPEQKNGPGEAAGRVPPPRSGQTNGNATERGWFHACFYGMAVRPSGHHAGGGRHAGRALVCGLAVGPAGRQRLQPGPHPPDVPCCPDAASARRPASAFMAMSFR